MSKKSTALARIRQLSGLGLPAGLFVSSVLPVLRGLTAAESAAFFWVDETGAIANFYADRLPPLESFPCAAEAPVFLSGSAGWSEASRVFADEAVLASTAEAERASNTLYGEILRRNDACYILHGLVVHERAVIGRMSLFRPAEGRPFGANEAAALASVLRYVSQGVVGAAGAGLVPGEAEEVLEQELVVADRGGQVLHATEAGRRLLLLATGCPLGPRTVGLARSISQQLLQALCGGGAVGPLPPPPPVMTRETLWGRFALRTYWLGDHAGAVRTPVGVHIVRSQPACLRFVQAMNALPLSPQQREIALLIARNASNRDIAARLSVSINTVAYHVKQLFFKLRVHDRGELLARINAVTEGPPAPESPGSSAPPDTASAGSADPTPPAAPARAPSREAAGT